jgi:hypothetical protein
VVDATNIVIHDDGCKYPGDTVTFTADFQVSSSANTRLDIGLWFAVDGDPNNDGALTGGCLAETPFYNKDGDACGDIADGQNPQYPQYTVTTVCKANAYGWLLLPYCSSWRIQGADTVCTSPYNAIPATTSKCKCDVEFFVDIPVPPNGGGGGAIGDPHLETWYNRRFDFSGLCDLVFLHSANFANGRGLDIHIRTSEREGTSYIATAVIKMGQEKLEVHEDGSYYWNDELNVELPATFGDTKMNHTVIDGWLPIWEMTTPRGGRIFVQVFDVMVDVKLYDFLNETVTDSVGLLGNFTTGFLTDRKGNWMFDTDQYGHEWQVRDNEPMLFHEAREPQYPLSCAMPDVEAVSRRLEFSDISLEEAQKLCAPAGTYYEACVMDLRLFHNRETAKAYAFMHQLGHRN